jgi:hypothetical protein
LYFLAHPEDNKDELIRKGIGKAMHSKNRELGEQYKNKTKFFIKLSGNEY